MRLKEDTSNWRASNILRKVKEVPETPRFHKKKDTRKWCKGKVGIQHSYKLAKKFVSQVASYNIYKCENCNKEKYIW